MINEQVFRLKKDGTPNKNCLCRNPELIENYDKAIADTSQTWYCHHRLETHNSDGERRLVDITHKELIALGMYYDRPPEELIFLTKSEHRSLHNKGNKYSKGMTRSKEHKAKIGAAHKGIHRSDETRAKISTSLKESPFIEELKVRMSALHKGKHWKLVNGKRVWLP